LYNAAAINARKPEVPQRERLPNFKSIKTMAGTGFLSGILRPGAPPSAVRIRHLNHSFGEGDSSKQVLFDIELELAPGEIVIMTGPSGSGKTTLLTLIGAPRTATVIAKENVTLYALSKADFKATLEASSSFAEGLRKVFFMRQ